MWYLESNIMYPFENCVGHLSCSYLDFEFQNGASRENVYKLWQIVFRLT